MIVLKFNIIRKQILFLKKKYLMVLLKIILYLQYLLVIVIGLYQIIKLQIQLTVFYGLIKKLLLTKKKQLQNFL